MAVKGIAASLLVLVLCCMTSGAFAGEDTGTGFPFVDNCRRSKSNTAWALTHLNSTVRQKSTDMVGSRHCFRITVKSTCNANGWRCCNTLLSKIKVYVNPECRSSRFGLMTITNPQLAFPTGVSPSSDQTNATYFSVKWSWRATAANLPEIPMDKADGTEFCFDMKRPYGGSTFCQSLANITNNVGKGFGGLTDFQQRMFEISLYDRKDVYECCPTYAFNV